MSIFLHVKIMSLYPCRISVLMDQQRALCIIFFIMNSKNVHKKNVKIYIYIFLSYLIFIFPLEYKCWWISKELVYNFFIINFKNVHIKNISEYFFLFDFYISFRISVLMDQQRALCSHWVELQGKRELLQGNAQRLKEKADLAKEGQKAISDRWLMFQI